MTPCSLVLRISLVVAHVLVLHSTGPFLALLILPCSLGGCCNTSIQLQFSCMRSVVLLGHAEYVGPRVDSHHYRRNHEELVVQARNSRIHLKGIATVQRLGDGLGNEGIGFRFPAVARDFSLLRSI
jgi:hypothetical protein